MADAAKKLLTLSHAPAGRVQVSVFAGPEEHGLHDLIKVHGLDGTISYPQGLELVAQFTVSKLSALIS